MKPGLLLIAAAGACAVMVRLAGADGLADAAGIAYLVAATVTYSRPLVEPTKTKN